MDDLPPGEGGGAFRLACQNGGDFRLGGRRCAVRRWGVCLRFDTSIQNDKTKVRDRGDFCSRGRNVIARIFITDFFFARDA